MTYTPSFQKRLKYCVDPLNSPLEAAVRQCTKLCPKFIFIQNTYPRIQTPYYTSTHRPYETPDHEPDGRLGDGACREGYGGLLGDDPPRQVATDGLTCTQKVRA